MSKPKVFIVKKPPKDVEHYIAQYCDFEIWEKEDNITYAETIERVKDKEGYYYLE